jgi:hypothetical protein
MLLQAKVHILCFTGNISRVVYTSSTPKLTSLESRRGMYLQKSVYAYFFINDTHLVKHEGYTRECGLYDSYRNSMYLCFLYYYYYYYYIQEI